MRLWSLHPKYLDAKGLVALWREALLARKVLENKTRGYKHHPQLARFYASGDPLKFINLFLHEVYNEACLRGYTFDKTKVDIPPQPQSGFIAEFITVTDGQLQYEFGFLQHKLLKRDIKKYNENRALTADIAVNPVFKVVPGGIAEWEKVKILPDMDGAV
ncbi:pyrimidine dimer DNA glycosylase/endonuclease V [Treponema sp. HNW]|uniref:pyrimidine dimer DNA glycosylase/endonuclease V n=1 Tax=Treponema sp. HNW TaxID=3116654 RepID=UPI003D0D5E97